MPSKPAHSSRRSFLKSTAAAAVPIAAACLSRRRALAAAAPMPAAAVAGGSPKKSVLFSMLPKELPVVDRFKIAIDAGFVGVEMHTEPDKAQAELARDAAAKTGLKIH